MGPAGGGDRNNSRVEGPPRQPVAFTKAQLHLLEQQIDGLYRISVRLKAMKYKARTGMDLLPAGCSRYGKAPLVFGIASSPHAERRVARAPAGRRQRQASAPSGRGAKRSRREASDDDEELSDDDGSEGESGSEGSEEEEEEEDSEGGSSEEEEEEGDDDIRLADGSDDDERRPGTGHEIATPGRRSGRQAKPLLSLKELLAGGGEEEEEEEEDGGSPGAAAAQRDARPAALAPTRLGLITGNTKAKGFKVLQDEGPSASTKAVVLPELRPVRVAWGVGDEAVCSACGDGDHAEGNAILFCEGSGCSVAVHQRCYGVKSVPRGKWLCDACSGKREPSAANCACCPVVGGALRKVVSFGRTVAKRPAGSAYVHLACALWTPELVIRDPDRMHGIQLDHMTALRAALPCGRCKQAGGAVIQCSLGSCCRSFHVLCGLTGGQTLAFRTTDGQPLAFCSLHSSHRFRRSREAIVEGRHLAAGEEPSSGEEGGSEGEQACHAGAGAAAAPPTAYELERLERIARNKQIWEEMRAGAAPAAVT